VAAKRAFGLNEQLLQVSNTLLSYYLNAEAVKGGVAHHRWCRREGL